MMLCLVVYLTFVGFGVVVVAVACLFCLVYA